MTDEDTEIYCACPFASVEEASKRYHWGLACCQVCENPYTKEALEKIESEETMEEFYGCDCGEWDSYQVINSGLTGCFQCQKPIVKKQRLYLMRFEPVQIGGPKECDRFMSELVKRKKVSNEAFKLTYYIIYEMGCWGTTAQKIAEMFDWDLMVTMVVIEEVERLGVCKIV